MKKVRYKFVGGWIILCMFLFLSAASMQAAAWLSFTGEPTETSITLRWKQKRADGYRIYRANILSDGNIGAERLVAQISGKKTSYVDRNVVYGKGYHYTIERIGKRGGKQKVIARGTEEVMMRFSKPFWEEEFFSDGFYSPNMIELAFEQQDGLCPNGYEIYRREEGQKYQRLAVINRRQRHVTYKDKKIVPGKTYEYRIRSFRKKNGKKQYSKYSSVLRRYAYTKPEGAVFQVKPTLLKDRVILEISSQAGNGFLFFQKNDIFEIMSWGADDEMLDDAVLYLKQYSTNGVTYQDATVSGTVLREGETIYLQFMFDDQKEQVPDITKGYKVDGQLECGYLNFTAAELFIDMKTYKTTCNLNMEAYH